MATHRAQREEVPKGTRAVHTDTAKQRYFMETSVRDHDHQTSGQPLGSRATQVPTYQSENERIFLNYTFTI